MNLENVIGMAATAVAVIGFVPQVIKTFTTKKAEDVALTQPILIAIGMCFWTVYGVMIGDFVIVTSNILIFSLNLAVVGMKITYSREKTK